MSKFGVKRVPNFHKVRTHTQLYKYRYKNLSKYNELELSLVTENCEY